MDSPSDAIAPRYDDISACPNGNRYSVLASLVLTNPVTSVRDFALGEGKQTRLLASPDRDGSLGELPFGIFKDFIMFLYLTQ